MAVRATDLADLSASELLSLYRKRAVSPVEATRACLERVDQLDADMGAFCLVDAEGALVAAAESEARWQKGAPIGLVDGVPTTIKDLFLSKGWPTRRGSRTTDDAPPDEVDAPCVARLREHGAVFLGKTTTPEFGWKAITDNPRGEVARNPWNRTRTAGGSSGGAAVAAGLGMGALHIGSDGGGSIRVPSSFCGIFGLKPTFGRVPAWPLSPFGTVSHVGPMTRTVADAALMLTVLSEPDARDWHGLPWDRRDYRIGLEEGVRGLRIAASVDLGYIDVEEPVRAAFAAALDAFTELGAIVDTVDPGFANPRDLFARTWFPGAANVLRAMPEAKRALVDPGLRAIAEEGAAMTPAQILDAQRERGELGVHMQLFFERYDLLLTPATALVAFGTELEVPDRARYPRWIDWAGFSYPFNLTQQPAASVPCGLSPNGLPIGLQIVGPKYADALVLRAARAFEAARPQALPGAARKGA
jgi:aspartyl-tRNA(Asn)/glutamyl-tRNA(Gln) amidotransferase subunit A